MHYGSEKIQRTLNSAKNAQKRMLLITFLIKFMAPLTYYNQKYPPLEIFGFSPPRPNIAAATNIIGQ